MNRNIDGELEKTEVSTVAKMMGQMGTVGLERSGGYR